MEALWAEAVGAQLYGSSRIAEAMYKPVGFID